MNRKKCAFTLILLTIALALPSVYAYPIEDIDVQPLPDMIAGNSYVVIVTFDNVARETITFVVNITVTSEIPGAPLGMGEIFINEIKLNGLYLDWWPELSAGVFTTVEGSVSFSADNELIINVSTAINLMPGAYTFKVDLMGEEMVEPVPTFRSTKNKLPIAEAGPSRTVYIGEFVEFSGANSTDIDGTILSYEWDFGDGSEASGVNVSHRYMRADNYTVTLTVRDNRSGEDTDTCVITVIEEVIITPLLPPFLDNLNVTPAVIELGDEVTISFDIMNPNDRHYDYMVTMRIGELTLLVDSDMEAYESKTLSRTITPSTVGVYNVTVDGMTGSFTVEPEAEPEPEPEPEPAWEYDSTYRGIEIQVWMPDGTPYRAYFNGTWHQGDVETLQTQIDLYLEPEPEPEPPKPAEFEFSDLRIFYPGLEVEVDQAGTVTVSLEVEVEVDQTVTVTVSIEAENTGELEGSRTVELKVNGYVVDSQEVTLKGGASVTVLFELKRGEGTYEVEVEGLTESYAITTIPEPPPFWTGFKVSVVLAVSVSAGIIVFYVWRRR